MSEFIMLSASWTMVLIIIFAVFSAVCAFTIAGEDGKFKMFLSGFGLIWIAIVSGCWLEVYGTI